MLASATDVCEHGGERSPERAGVRDSIHHEALKRFVCVQGDESAITLQVVDVDPAGAQAGGDSSGMVRSRDQKGRIALYKTFADKAADDAAQGIRIVVELHAMKMWGT